MQYKLTKKQLRDAEAYADLSEAHTHDYGGSEGVSEKRKRIVQGNIGQYWLHDYCNALGHVCVSDDSYYDENDNYDLKIYGYRVDFKCAAWVPTIGQITSKLDKDTETEVYMFALIDRDYEWIEPIGASGKQKVKEHAVKVPAGEPIPGTSKAQLLRPHSYFMPRDLMTGFDDALEWMKEHRRDA